MNNREVFPVNIKVSDSFWGPKIENVVERVIPYQWELINDKVPDAEPSHCIKNFKIAAGLEEGEFKGYQFQDTDLAKWIEAASYSLMYKDSSELRENLKYAVDLIGKAQQDDGYMDTYFILKKPDKKWKELSHGHELYTSGHMLEAAVAYYCVTGDDSFMKIMDKNINLICSVFGKGEGKIDSYPGHEEIELALVKAYRITGDKKYLDLSTYFIEGRGEKPGFFNEETFIKYKSEKNYLDEKYYQIHAKIREQAVAEGHAVRAGYFFSGAADVALENGDQSLFDALDRIWDNTINRRTYIIGGMGSQGDGERFTIDYDLPNDRPYNETCAAVSLAMWGYRMLKLRPDVKYADIMERALYNNVLSGISYDGEKYFYVNPLYVKPDVAEFREDHEHEINRVRWFGCACCPPNVVRTICMIGGYIYTQSGKTVYNHLFIGNEAKFGSSTLIAESSMPFEGKAKITVQGSSDLNLAFRIPSYAKNCTIRLNGQKAEYNTANGYAIFSNTLNDGDIYEICFDMDAKFIIANPKVTEDNSRLAILRGPIVYCAEEIDNFPYLNDFKVNTQETPILSDSDIFGSIKEITVNGTVSSKESFDNKALYRELSDSRNQAKLKLIPYFLWNNRGQGEMIVWLHY